MISAVITASGNSTRFGEDKLLEKIDGIPVIVRTAMLFKRATGVDEILLTVRKDNKIFFEKMMKRAGVKVCCVVGGKERVISVYNGVKAAKGEWVVTHDGARPLTPVSLIEGVAKEVKKAAAVMTAVVPTATIKKVSNSTIKTSFPRENTLIAQTPQAFKRSLALIAFKKAIDDKYFTSTDDSEFVSRIGEKVKVIPGDERNIKITVPMDLIVARQMWRMYENSL